MPEIISYIDWLPLVLVLRLLKMFTAYFYADPGYLSRIPDPNFSIPDPGSATLKKDCTALSSWESSTAFCLLKNTVKFQIPVHKTPVPVFLYCTTQCLTPKPYGYTIRYPRISTVTFLYSGLPRMSKVLYKLFSMCVRKKLSCFCCKIKLDVKLGKYAM
jgi:hypothetical protein